VHRLRLATAVAGLALALTGAAQPCNLAPYPPSATVECDKSIMPPGATVTCTAGGFEPSGGGGGMVTVDVECPGGFHLTDEVEADSNGDATFTFTVPRDTRDGPCTVAFSSDGCVRVAAATLIVDSSLLVPPGGPQPPGEPLPRTGLELSRGLLIVLVVVLVGGGLLLLASRRRRRDDQDVASAD